MTQDEIIEMAAEIWNAGSSFPIPSSDDVLRFAKLVADKENKECEKLAATPVGTIATAIRARRQA